MRVSRIFVVLFVFRLFTLISFAVNIFRTALALKFSKLTTVFVLLGMDCTVTLCSWPEFRLWFSWCPGPPLVIVYARTAGQSNQLTVTDHLPIPVAVWSKVYVCTHLVAGITGSNPAECVVHLLYLLCFVWRAACAMSWSLVQRSSTECACVRACARIIVI
jgi:hypothetical protein